MRSRCGSGKLYRKISFERQRTTLLERFHCTSPLHKSCRSNKGNFPQVVVVSGENFSIRDIMNINWAPTLSHMCTHTHVHGSFPSSQIWEKTFPLNERAEFVRFVTLVWRLKTREGECIREACARSGNFPNCIVRNVIVRPIPAWRRKNVKFEFQMFFLLRAVFEHQMGLWSHTRNTI